MEEKSKQLIFAMPGRMGDLIAVEPVLRHLAEKYPDRRKIWYTRPAFSGIYRYAPFIDEIIELKNGEEYQARKKTFPEDALLFEFNVKRTKPGPAIAQFPLLSGLTHNCCPEAACETPRFYRSETAELPELPQKYAVFHCASNGRLRQWQPCKWNKLARCCIRAGLSVIEVGEHAILTEPDVIHCNGLIDFQKAAGIMAQAQFFIGMESGFAHLANAFNVFGIIVAGKLKEYPDYNPYTGFYSPDGNGCNMVRFYNEYPLELPESIVENCLQRALNGHPMTYAECQLYCREMQIRSMQESFSFRAVRILCFPFKKLYLHLLAHQAKHH